MMLSTVSSKGLAGVVCFCAKTNWGASKEKTQSVNSTLRRDLVVISIRRFAGDLSHTLLQQGDGKLTKKGNRFNGFDHKAVETAENYLRLCESTSLKRSVTETSNYIVPVFQPATRFSKAAVSALSALPFAIAASPTV